MKLLAVFLVSLLLACWGLTQFLGSLGWDEP